MLKNGINKIEIESYDELVKIIYGKHEENKIDLREDFIFRGVSDIKYELIPSSLRKDNLNQLKIDELIENNKKFWIEVSENEVKEKNLECYEDEVDYKKRFYIQVDKYGNPTSGKNKDYTVAKNELQNEKELYILQKFFNYADRCGLKVNTNKFTRALIHPTSQLSDKNEGLLLQTLLRTQRVAFTTLGSSRPLSSVNIDILLCFRNILIC